MEAISMPAVKDTNQKFTHFAGMITPRAGVRMMRNIGHVLPNHF
jgi:hypothetical protein